MAMTAIHGDHEIMAIQITEVVDGVKVELPTGDRNYYCLFLAKRAS